VLWKRDIPEPNKQLELYTWVRVKKENMEEERRRESDILFNNMDKIEITETSNVATTEGRYPDKSRTYDDE
jgi:hypothetical protein